MPSETFHPQLADRECNRAKHQVWEQVGNEGSGDINGADLAKRLWSLGVIEHVETLLDIPQDSCIKTGVSAYRRLK